MLINLYIIVYAIILRTCTLSSMFTISPLHYLFSNTRYLHIIFHAQTLPVRNTCIYYAHILPVHYLLYIHVVLDPPIITCQKIAHAKPNTANFVISCNIAMVPNPTNGFWNWTDPNGDEMKLPLRGEIENLTAYFEVSHYVILI